MIDQILFYVVRVGETWAIWEMTAEAMAKLAEKDSTLVILG